MFIFRDRTTLIGIIIIWVTAFMLVLILRNSGYVARGIVGYEAELVVIGDDTFFLDVADTQEKRAVGLSKHTSIGESGGMLFVFYEPKAYPFWMLDMDFALDILWINSEKKIMYIVSNIEPKTFPKTFAPQEDEAMYVLEILAGETEKREIKIGDSVVFERR